MKFVSKKIIIASAVGLTAIILAVTVALIFILQSGGSSNVKEKIYVQHLSSSGTVASSNGLTSNEIEKLDSGEKYTMQVSFIYEEYSEAIYSQNKIGNESYAECSKRYHSEKNNVYFEQLGELDCEAFVSEYTPFVILTFNAESSLIDLYNIALEIAENDFVGTIWLNISGYNIPDIVVD